MLSSGSAKIVIIIIVIATVVRHTYIKRESKWGKKNTISKSR